MGDAFRRKAAVIGGCGYIGSRLTLSLLDRGTDAVIFDPAPCPEDVRNRCEVIPADIITGHGLAGAFAGFDTVFLIAGALARLSTADPIWGFDLNIVGVTRVVRELLNTAPVPRVVLASTVAIDDIGNWTGDWYSQKPSFYAISRMAGEAMLASACACSEMQALSLRMFTVYGPGPSSGSRGHFIASLMERAAAGDPLLIHGDGSICVDVTHMDDVTNAFMLAMDTPSRPGGFATYYIGSGRETRLKEIAEWIQEVVPWVKVEYQLDAKPALRRTIGDISRARDELGYSPSVSPEKGIKQVARDYFSRHKQAATAGAD
jgi:nucleoside-diphosphate-sugar epimerase